jgi:hypothetical protein
MEISKKKEFEQRLIEKAMKDEAFRKLLLENPKEAISGELGMKLPSGLKIHVMEEKAGEVYLILPKVKKEGEEQELTEAELSSVAGGMVAVDELGSGWSYCGC